MPKLKFLQLDSVFDPDIAMVSRQFRKYFELAADKAVANSIDPARFPLKEGTIESILSKRLGFIPKANPKKGETDEDIKKAKEIRLAKVQKKWKARYSKTGEIKMTNKKDRLYFGELTNSVRLASKESIFSQIPKNYLFNSSPKLVELTRNLALPLNQANPLSVNAYNWIKDLLGAGATSSNPAPQKTILECLIKEVKCWDETNGFCGSEAGSDEIKLGGLKVSPCAVVTKIRSFNVKSFEEDGDTKVYNAPDYKKFTDFSLTDEGDWPRSFFVTFLLAEIDMGGFGEFLSELIEQVRIEIAIQLAEMVGGAAATTLLAAGIVGVVAAAVVVALMVIVFIVVIALVNFLKTVWEDDIFQPNTVCITLNNENEANNIDYVGEDLWSSFGLSGHGGLYQIRYSWRSK